MAYGVKYRLRFKDNKAVQWIADIYQDGFAGSVTNVVGWTNNPISLDVEAFDDPFEPVIHSNVTLKLASQTNDEFRDFQTADLYEYYLDLQRDGSTYWKGILIAEPYEEDYTSAPYETSIVFNDAMSDLQFIRYEDSGTVRSATDTVINILVKCFNELPTEMARSFREMINVFDDAMNDADTEGLLEQLYLFEGAFWELDDDDKIKGINCLDVVREIMSSLKCRIVVSQDKYYIQRVQDMKATTAIKYVDYDSSGTVTGNSTLDLRRAKSAKTAAMPTLLVPVGGRARTTFNRSYQEIEFEYSSKNNATIGNNVILNWNFDMGSKLQGVNNSVVPLHWTRSSALNTQLGVDGTGMHLESYFGFANHLRFENSMLEKTRIGTAPVWTSDVLTVDSTREGYSLISESPSNTNVTFKNLLSDNSDSMVIKFAGYFDYTYVSGSTISHNCYMHNKWTIKLGSKYYNTSNQTWSTLDTSRVTDTEWSDNDGADQWLDSTGFRRRHHFEREVVIANFPADSTDDLTITWFVPETFRSPYNGLGVGVDAIDKIDIVFANMQCQYVSNDSTEFEINKVLGETDSTTKRPKRKVVKIKHSDGPSKFSVNSWRLPTTNFPTSSWSTRGGSEADPHYDIMVIKAMFENLANYRQVWNGKLFGFLELHNTVSGIESKVWLIKRYSFDVKGCVHTVSLHEMATFATTVAYTPQVTLSPFTAPTDSGNPVISATESAIDAGVQAIQGVGAINVTTLSLSPTQVIRANNDKTETGTDYPV